MPVSKEQFRKLCDMLDKFVLDAGDIARADDIHPAIRAIGAYVADGAALPRRLAELKAMRPQADERVAEKTEAVRQAAHPVTMAADKLRRLNGTLAHNAKLAEQEMEPELPAKPAAAYAIGLDLPVSRRQRVAQLADEIAAAEAEAKDAKRKLKNAKDALRRAKDRSEEIRVETESVERSLADHGARIGEMGRLLCKTLSHLSNRICDRERKRARKLAAAQAVAPEAPKAPTDEDIRALAESNGLPVVTADDLEAARQLFA